MNTEELLDELRVNILRDNSSSVSGTADQLWSDDTLIRYINEAYFRFCRKSLALMDRTTPTVVELTTETLIDTYTLHSSILAVVSARFEGDAVDLGRTGHSILDTPYKSDDSLYFDVNLLSALPPGKPVAFATDEGDSILRLFPAPTADYANKTISMRVIRTPLTKLSLDNPTAEPEIREEWHLDMLHWAAYLALSNHDVDAERTAKAAFHKAAFEEVVKDVEREAKRRRFAATAWNFGQSGFSYIK